MSARRGKPRARRTLVIPDVHIPYHDRAAWNLTLKVIAKIKPDEVRFMGDALDFYAVSSFPKAPSRPARLEHEIDCGNDEFDRVECDNVVFHKGNHEARLEKYLTCKAPELFGLVETHKLLKFKERGWRYHEYMTHDIDGKVLYTHDLGFSGKHASLHTLAAAGHCVVFGHTHRGAVYYGGTVKGEHRFAMNVGWLGDPNKIDYMHKASTRDWQQGFGLVDFDSKGRAWATFCPIVGGKVCIDGEWYQ